MNNKTKERAQAIYQTAIKAIETFGVHNIDRLSGSAKKGQLCILSHLVADREGCTYQTARRYIRHALHYSHNQEHNPFKPRGGWRPGGGRKPKST